jgi:MazG family protein
MTTPDFSAIARAEGAARASSEREAIARLIDLVGVIYRLRDPDGCPWDRAQSVDSMSLNLLEEAAETQEAIANGKDADVCEELGDTLMNIVLMARIAEQEGRFGLAQVAAGIAEKLVRRHPHVFGDTVAKDADAVLANWAKLKAAEKAEKGKHGALDGIPRSAPALLRATRAGEKAGAVGFDWSDADGPRAKVDEELRELDEARGRGDREEMQRELGDTLFALTNLARKLGLDAEQALREATDRFGRRFRHVEMALATDGRAVSDAGPDEQERLWQSAKRAEALK